MLNHAQDIRFLFRIHIRYRVLPSWATVTFHSKAFYMLFLRGTIQHRGLVRGKLITGETKARLLDMGIVTPRPNFRIKLCILVINYYF